jgi:hypothetical protein
MNVRNKNSIRNSKKDLNSSNKHRQSNDKGGSYLWNGIVQGRRENHRQMVPLLALAAILVYMTFHSITTVSLWTSSPLRISKEPDSGQPPLKSISSLPPSYELWDHRTSTIQFPSNSNYRLEPDKPTSLELLQQVLQGSTTVDIIAEDRSAQQQQQQQRPSHQSSRVSCYEPNIAATRSLAERVEQERRKVKKRQQKLQQQANKSSTVRIRTTQTIIVPPLSFPILNVGMPKSGSSTLRDFFRKQLHWGENTTHYEVNTQRNATTTMYIGQEMVRAIRDGHTDPFYYIPNHYQIHTQMDYTGPTMNIFPQIQLLDEIHTSHPHATFILLFRPVQDWIQSTQSWHKYPFRWANGGPQNDIPGLLLTPEQRIARDGRGEKIVLTKEQLADWWCDHVHHIRSFVMAYPTHSLIELSLADTDGTTTQLLKSLFDLGRKDPDNLGRDGRDDDDDVDKDKDDETTPIWGTSNYNPSNKRSFLGAIHQPIKYYELWNHATHSMPKNSSLDTMSNDSHHTLTSLEILERIMHDEQDQDGTQKHNAIMDEEWTAASTSTADCFRPRNNNNDIKVMDDPLIATTTINHDNNGMNISYPILHVGMPLVGNTFLERYFRDCIIGGRIHVTSKKLKGIGLVGKKMMEAVHAGLPPINGYFGLPDGNDGHAFTQLEYTSVLPNTGSSIYEKVSDKERDYSSFPQIQLLDEIHEDVPYATFILPFRGNNQTKKNIIDHDRGRGRHRMLGLPNDDATGDDEARSEHPRHELEDWIYLAQNYHNFTERWAAMDDIPGLVLTREQKEARMVLRTERVEQQQQYEEKNNEGGRTTTTAPTPSSAISLPLQPPMERLSDGQLKDWWCRHIRHVRKFVEFYPTHRLLELDLTDEEETYNKLLHWFPQTNATCLSELWKTTDFL